MTDQVRIRLLGGFSVVVGDRPVPAGAWRLRKARTLLKLLCLAPGHRLHRDQLYDLLWPDLDRTAAANNLHQALYALRRALGAAGAPGDTVVLRDDLVLLAPGGGVRIDLDDFETAARRAYDSGKPADYRTALALGEKDLLPEDRYEAWASEASDALPARRTTLRLGWGEALEREGRASEAVEVLRALIGDDPLHEPAYRALMRVLAEAGRRGEALAVYEGLRNVFREETGSDPDPQTRRLYRVLLADSVEVPEPQARSPGRRHAGSSRRRLPAPATPLIGRERETAEVEQMLGRSGLFTLTGAGGCGKTRLALAVAARRGDDFRDGAYFVDLAGLAEPDLVPEAVATALDIQLPPYGGGRDALIGQLGEREMLLVLDNCEHLIDACAALASQIIARCPGVLVLATSREALRSYGERTFRVPSLSLPDPHRLPPVAELGRFASVRLFVERAADAAPGFRLSDGNAAAVAQICFRLDGMPLALELAAARVRVLAPQQIAERLDDALALLGQGGRRGATRQETLLATLEWSHRLLDADERRLLRRLAVFLGSFSLAAAEEVCGDGLRPSHRSPSPDPRTSPVPDVRTSPGPDLGASPVLDLLGRLADKSLVCVEPHQDEVRYRLLETIRQYAMDRLRAAGEAEVTEARHRHVYLALAEAQDQEPSTGVSGAASSVLEADYGNLRAALRSLLRHEPDKALRLAVALRSFWPERGRLAEGRRWLDAALAAAPDPTPERARALMGRAVLAIRLGDGSELEDIAEQIVRIHEHRPRDAAAAAFAHCQEAVLLWMRGVGDRARTALDLAASLAREAGEPRVLAVAAYLEGVWAVCRGEGAVARAACRRCLRLLDDVPARSAPFLPVMTPGYTLEEDGAGTVSLFFEETVLAGRTVGGSRARGYTLANLAWALRAEGDLHAASAAVDAAEQSVDCFRTLDDPYGESLALNVLGNVHRGRGDHARARKFLDAALSIRRRLGDHREEGITLGCLGLLQLAEGDLDGAQATIARVLAGFEETDDIPGMANSLLHLALVARAGGRADRARDLLVRARQLEHVPGSPPAAGWVALMLAHALSSAGETEAARREAASADALFTRLGDARGPSALRRAVPGAGGRPQSGC
ncbi:BTAD domain-containing putative transcriptional regulator [Streptomyces sp. NPDC127063]|uniref:BTAD domain-containing putative transcriptional regulator n=1 Tax=Streptomyces sp. NPDC127063 TaxID=3347123 RepID=UPI00366732F9